MTTFDEREKAAETGFVLDQDMVFRAHARRDRKLGLWAAQLAGLDAPDAAAYAESLVADEVAGASDARLIARVAHDLAAAKISQSEPSLRAKMDEFLSMALAEVKAGR